MTTPAEQEAERRYDYHTAYDYDQRLAFVAGAEWSESRYRELLEAGPYIAFASGCEWAWAHPPDHIQELLEAAREYRDACDKVRDARAFTDEWYAAAGVRDDAEDRLLAAAAALEEANEDAG